MSKIATAAASTPSYSSMSRQKLSNFAEDKSLLTSIAKASAANKIAQSISSESESEDDEVDMSQPPDQNDFKVSRMMIDVSSDEERDGMRLRRATRKKRTKGTTDEKSDTNGADEIAARRYARHSNDNKNDENVVRGKELVISVTSNDEYTDEEISVSEDPSKIVFNLPVDKTKLKLKKTEAKYKAPKKKPASTFFNKLERPLSSANSAKKADSQPPSKKVKNAASDPSDTVTPKIDMSSSVVSSKPQSPINSIAAAGPTPPITVTTTLPTVEPVDKQNLSTDNISSGPASSRSTRKKKKIMKRKPHAHSAQRSKTAGPSLKPFLHLQTPIDAPTVVSTFINHVILDLQPSNVINRVPYLYQLWDPDHHFEVEMSQKNVERQIDLRMASHTEALFKSLHASNTRISLSLQLITIPTPTSTDSQSISFLLVFASWMSPNLVHHEELLSIAPIITSSSNFFDELIRFVTKTIETFHIKDRLLAVTIDAEVAQFCTAESISNRLTKLCDSDSLVAQRRQIYGIYSLSSAIDIVARTFLKEFPGGQAWSAAMIYTQRMPTHSVIDRLRFILYHFTSNYTDGQEEWECLFSYASNDQKKDFAQSSRKRIQPDSPLSPKSTYTMLRDAVALREILDRAVRVIPALQSYYITDNEWKLVKDVYKLLHVLYWLDSLVSGSPDSHSEPRFMLYILTLNKIREIVHQISQNDASGIFENCDLNLQSAFFNAFKFSESVWLLSSLEWPELGFLASLLDPRQMDAVSTEIVGEEKTIFLRELLGQFANQYDNLSPVIDIEESDGEPMVVDMMGSEDTSSKNESAGKDNKLSQSSGLQEQADESQSVNNENAPLNGSSQPSESQGLRTLDSQSTSSDDNEEFFTDRDINGADQENSAQESESEDDAEFAALERQLVLGVPATLQKAQMNDYFTEQLLPYTNLADSELMLRWWAVNGKSHLEYAAAARDIFGVAASVEGISARVLGSEFRTLLGDRVAHLSFSWLCKLVHLRALTRRQVR